MIPEQHGGDPYGMTDKSHQPTASSTCCANAVAMQQGSSSPEQNLAAHLRASPLVPVMCWPKEDKVRSSLATVWHLVHAGCMLMMLHQAIPLIPAAIAWRVRHMAQVQHGIQEAVQETSTPE